MAGLDIIEKCLVLIDPRLEATSALDGESEAFVQQALENASRGRFVILRVDLGMLIL